MRWSKDCGAARVQSAAIKRVGGGWLGRLFPVQDLANRMAERVVDVIKTLMKLGMMVTATQTIEASYLTNGLNWRSD